MTTGELDDIARRVKEYLLKEAIEVGDLREVSTIENILSLPALLREGTWEESVAVPLSLLVSDIRVTDTHIQCQVGGGEWRDLLPLEEIHGEPGDDAFQVWRRREGNADKTPDDYVAYLKAPATEAAVNLGGVVDGIRRDARVTLDETRAEVGRVLEETGMRRVLSLSETETGVLRYGGREYKVYELTAQLAGLPVTAGVTADITLSEQPLGDGLYLSVDCLSVSTGTGFAVSAYKVRRVWLNAARDTVVTVDCLEDVTGEPRALLTIRYARGLLSFETFSLSIPMDGLGTGSADGVTVDIPALKYDKRLALSYAMDDGKPGVYHHFFKYAKERGLCYTDGCGNDMPFAFGNAWATYNQLGIDLHVNPLEANGMLWGHVVEMLDFGGGIYNHGGGVYDKPGTDKTDELARRSLGDNREAITRETGVFPFCSVVPGGGTDYMAPFLRVIPEDVTLYDWGSQSFGNYHMDASTVTADTLSRLKHGRINWDDDHSGKDLEGIKARIREAHDLYDRSIYYCFSHNPGSVGLPEDIAIAESTVHPYLDWTHATYGKGGSDTIWVAAHDEIYEYLFSRHHSVVAKSVRGGDLVLDVKLAVLPNFSRKDLCLVIRGDGGIITPPAVTATGAVTGLACAIRPDGSLMVNASLGTRRLDLAEKYVAAYELTREPGDRADAIHMAGRLREALRRPFLDRIAALEVPPSLVSVTIDSGAATTYEREVAVTLAVTGPVTHYRVSEDPDLSAVAWVATSSLTFALALSATAGAKTVYVQVRNGYGDSSVVSASITLQERPAVTFTVTGRSDDNALGTVLPATREVSPGATASLTATASAGHVIDSWSGATSATGVGTASGTATVTNVQEDRVVTCAFRKEGAAPSRGRAVVSLGWDFSTPEVPNNGSMYDPGMKVTRVRVGSATASVIDIYDVSGERMGTLTNAVGWTVGNETFQGNVTGDGSGRYADEVLRRLLYKPGSVASATMEISVPDGRYRFGVFINTKKTFDHSLASYTLESGGASRSFTLKSGYVDNFHDISEVTMDVSGVVTLTLATTDPKNATLLLNAIEIERMS